MAQYLQYAVGYFFMVGALAFIGWCYWASVVRPDKIKALRERINPK